MNKTKSKFKNIESFYLTYGWIIHNNLNKIEFFKTNHNDYISFQNLSEFGLLCSSCWGINDFLFGALGQTKNGEHLGMKKVFWWINEHEQNKI